jgi:A/G-specific adenine glycosylase
MSSSISLDSRVFRVKDDLHKLVLWFCQERRDLPWRRSSSSYAVWISEVMLQQTQVSVVIPYFNRWMERFPNVESLAAATLDDVIKLWEGLGYYSRARNLHIAALQIVGQWAGDLPRTQEELLAIKGMGPYTANAVRAFAFGDRCVAVDGNVARVGARYLGISESTSKAAVRRQIAHELELGLPEVSPQLAAEGLIELGATLCLPRNPQCTKCPLQAGCYANETGRQAEFPMTEKRAETILLRRLVVVVGSNGHLLLRRGEEGKVMAGLYEFPYFDWDEREPTQADAIGRVWQAYHFEPLSCSPLTPVQHSFTRYRAQLLPWYLEIATPREMKGFEWHSIEVCNRLPFSSGHRKLLRQVTAIHADAEPHRPPSP